MQKVFIALGSNLGNSRAIMLAALKDMACLDGYEEIAHSGCWLSAPVGVSNTSIHPDYYNAAVKVHYSGSAQELLKHLLQIELKYGRQRLQVNSARTLDLDILLYGDMVIIEEELVIPHPRLSERAFVLLPLMQLEPNLVIPDKNNTVAELWQNMRDKTQQKIREVTWDISGGYY